MVQWSPQQWNRIQEDLSLRRSTTNKEIKRNLLQKSFFAVFLWDAEKCLHTGSKTEQSRQRQQHGNVLYCKYETFQNMKLIYFMAGVRHWIGRKTWFCSGLVGCLPRQPDNAPEDLSIRQQQVLGGAESSCWKGTYQYEARGLVEMFDGNHFIRS